MSDLICSRCGDETNEPPPEFPQEWKGLCPACAVEAALKGDLPGEAAAKSYLISRLLDAVMSGDLPDGLVQVHVLTVGTGDEIIDTPLGPVVYSQN